MGTTKLNEENNDKFRRYYSEGKEKIRDSIQKTEEQIKEYEDLRDAIYESIRDLNNKIHGLQVHIKNEENNLRKLERQKEEYYRYKRTLEKDIEGYHVEEIREDFLVREDGTLSIIRELKGVRLG